MNNDNRPAFPLSIEADLTHDWPSNGMTLRDYFAASALGALVEDKTLSETGLSVACEAYEYADAMMEARKK